MKTPSLTTPRLNLLTCVVLLAMMNLAWQHAWVAEDAFINFRVIAHLLDGQGPVWNIGERVQVYTSAMWMALSAALTALGGEPVMATLALSWGLCGLTVLTLWQASGRHTTWWMVVTMAWLCSHSVRDYLCSGLETPLVMLTCAAGVLALGQRPAPNWRQTILILALAMLVRHDLAPLITPFAVQAWRAHTADQPAALPTPSRGRALWLGGSPLLAWSLWSTWYHGSPWPNTALAKLPPGWDGKLQALHYFGQLQSFDPWAYALMASALGLCWATRSPLRWPLLSGLMLFAAYLLRVGGDYMAGRFMVGPVTVCVCVMALAGRDAWAIHGGAWPIQARIRLIFQTTLTLAFTAYACPPSAPTGHSPTLQVFAHGIADERAYYWGQTDARTLLTRGVDPHLRANSQAIAHAMAQGERGPFVMCNIGINGYHAPSQAQVLDPLALTDRFLAGLPTVPRPVRVGHFERPLPRAYLDALRSGQFHADAPWMNGYFHDVHSVVRGPLWSVERLGAIWRLQTGAYSAHLAAWQTQDGGGMVQLLDVDEEVRAHGCLGSMGRVMVPRQLGGQLNVVKLPSPPP